MFDNFELDVLEAEFALENALIDVDLEMDDMSDYDSAFELFGRGKKSVADLLAKQEKKVKKIKTVGECDDKLAAINDSAKQFTDMVKKVMSAGEALQRGTIDKKEFKAQTKPIIKALKATMKPLGIALGNVVDDTKAPTSEEIKEFTDYVKGYRDLIKKRKAEIASGATESFGFDEDDFDFDTDSMFDDATESFDGMDYELESALIDLEYDL